MKNKVPELKKDMCLDIGCGELISKGFDGMDIRDCGQPIVWDCRRGIPYPDNSIKDIRSAHFLEHLDDDESADFLREVLRVLKSKGHFWCRVPLEGTPGACFFGHKTFWNPYKIESLNRMTEKLEPFTITKNEIAGIELIFTLEKI